MFVKVDPDLDDQALGDVVDVVHDLRMTGIVATNTTVSRQGLRRDPSQEGGLSGRPLRDQADRVLSFLRRECDPDTILIGVGGIMEPDDARHKMELGADLVQVYTGWVYGGPAFLRATLEALKSGPDQLA